MTQRDMAGYLGVDVKTIRNWKKNKTNLYEIVMKGFAFDKAIEQSKNNYEELVHLSENLKYDKNHK